MERGYRGDDEIDSDVDSVRCRRAQLVDAAHDGGVLSYMV